MCGGFESCVEDSTRVGIEHVYTTSGPKSPKKGVLKKRKKSTTLLVMHFTETYTRTWYLVPGTWYLVPGTTRIGHRLQIIRAQNGSPFLNAKRVNVLHQQCIQQLSTASSIRQRTGSQLRAAISATYLMFLLYTVV